ncbi:9758_t:CDS:2 [Entrophospora sp. SA101]|nr:10337_t:CDS:2 [Entrophospora sp. SA101]CAJ0828475.1 9758_t:CDS:2 [Entrophospora sp. SA101]CAJ0832300.1 11255_t:CDS:2 [Entrophospora sp. SA101]
MNNTKRNCKEWNVDASIVSKRTINPIREVVFNLQSTPNPNKEYISLALGDPTYYGNFKIDDNCVEAVIKQLRSFKANGYPPADIVIASGASDALNITIGALCNEADLNQLVELIDENTACILINNPSNPCGSNFSQEHLEAILSICETYKLPIISDEIYEDMVFNSSKFYPIANLTTTVPVLKISGLAKRFLVPGWRVGWVFIHDRNDVLKNVRSGLNSLANLILGANSLMQHALPDMLKNTPESFYQTTITQLEENARLSAEILAKIPGLNVIIPEGAMYIMFGINFNQFKDFKNDVDFTEKLVQEESVLCLPGTCFNYPNYIRIVITAPPEKLREAYTRIKEFCDRHHK